MKSKRKPKNEHKRPTVSLGYLWLALLVAFFISISGIWLSYGSLLMLVIWVIAVIIDIYFRWQLHKMVFVIMLILVSLPLTSCAVYVVYLAWFVPMN